MEIINERPYNTRKKWKCVFVQMIGDGAIREVARFTAWGDAARYVQQIKEAPNSTVQKVYIR